jgi:glycosyltransferase involved in cell wall biosynthesis
MQKSYKILILVPAKTARGGITNYYYSLYGKFTHNVVYFVRGSRTWPVRSNFIAELFRIISDVVLFTIEICKNKYDLIQTTTSFSKNAIIRDGIFILIAKLRGSKVIIFYRGWDYPFADRIVNKHLRLFKWIFFKTDAMIDLAQHNIDFLRSMGYNKQLFLETTLVDETLVKDLNPDIINLKYTSLNQINLLFLSRVEKRKGIFIVLAAFRELKLQYKNLNLIIAGDGSGLNEVKKYVYENSIQDIDVLGFIDGAKKTQIYLKSHIYIFPTLLTEGMSNSVLEALAFGLPVISRPMGGNADILKENIHGFLTMSEDPEDFVVLIKKLIDNPALMKKMALENFLFAKENFYSTVVVRRLENIFNSVMAASCAE